jgi:hypothetical protein
MLADLRQMNVPSHWKRFRLLEHCPGYDKQFLKLYDK